MARPKKEIDFDAFRKLCGIQCTLSEVASFFDCSPDTIERWCKRELKMSFAEAFKKYSEKGKISLRRTQFKLAETSTAMAIFLGKNYLNQRDNVFVDAPTQPSAIDQVAKLLLFEKKMNSSSNEQ